VATASPWSQDCDSGACLRLKDFAQALYLPNLPVSADMFRQKKAQSSEKLPVLPPVSIPRKSPGFTASGCVCNHIKYNSITQSGIILHFQVVAFKSGTEKNFLNCIINFSGQVLKKLIMLRLTLLRLQNVFGN